MRCGVVWCVQPTVDITASNATHPPTHSPTHPCTIYPSIHPRFFPCCRLESEHGTYIHTPTPKGKSGASFVLTQNPLLTYRPPSPSSSLPSLFVSSSSLAFHPALSPHNSHLAFNETPPDVCPLAHQPTCTRRQRSTSGLNATCDRKSQSSSPFTGANLQYIYRPVGTY